MDKRLKGTSKFISLELRHKPEEIGLTLDSNGWADVDELLIKMGKKGNAITIEDLKQIVDTNEKKRFAFNEDFTKIRANQGHSIEVDVELKPMMPPDVLYHGTAVKNRDEILRAGLHKMNRLYVHLSLEMDTAKNVGARHGKPVVLVIDAKAMHSDGYLFYLSENGVWLAEHVPAKYITEHV